MSKRSPGSSTVSAKLYEFDRLIIETSNYVIAGVDEAGRGAFAGPVVAAAVCLDYGCHIDGINDSKKLSGQAREKAYGTIIECVTGWAVGVASPSEIDKFNILEATYLAMQRALDSLTCSWNFALIDGNRSVPYIPENKQKTIIGGDGCSAAIAAASIIAKVTRDRIMIQYHDRYPQYDFMSNKGYGTEQHRNSILSHGLTDLHRKSFCENLVLQTRLPL